MQTLGEDLWGFARICKRICEDFGGGFVGICKDLHEDL